MTPKWIGRLFPSAPAAVLVMGCLGVSEANAQQGSARTGPEAAEIGEVVVTARRREKSLQRVPVAVTTANSEQLEQSGIDGPLDLDRLAPSLTVNNQVSSASTAFYSLRGQVGGSFFINATSPVAIYQDGVNIPHNNGTNVKLLDITRVEVLNGPQGTLYGRNSTGGAINFITRDADYNGVHGFMQLEAGNYEHKKYTVAVNVPLIDDVLTTRLIGQYNFREGFGRSAFTGQKLGEDRNDIQARLTVVFDPADNLNVELKGEYVHFERKDQLATPRFFDQRYPPNTSPGTQSAAMQFYGPNAFNVCPNPGNPGPCDGVQSQLDALLDAGTAGAAIVGAYIKSGNRDFHTSFNDFSRDQQTTWHGGLEITWDVTDSVRMKSISGYRKLVNWRHYDNDGTPFNNSGGGWGVADGGPLGKTTFCTHGIGTGTTADDTCFDLPFKARPYNQSEMYSQEFNLSGDFLDGRVDWLVGLFMSWDDMSSTQHAESRVGLRDFLATNTASLTCSVNPRPGMSCAASGGVDITDPASAGSAASMTPANPVQAGMFPRNALASFDALLTQDAWGLYTQNDFRLSDRLSLTLGGRYGEDRQTIAGSFTTPFFNGSQWLLRCLNQGIPGVSNTDLLDEEACRFRQRDKSNGFAYTASLNFQLNEDTLIYLKTARGYRAGSYASTSPTNPITRNEIATDYEIGFKADFLDRRLRTNLAVYQTDYDNKIETRTSQTATGVTATVTDNAAKATIRGVEAQVFVNPLEGLTGYLSGTYLDGEYDFYPGAILPGTPSSLPIRMPVIFDAAGEAFDLAPYSFNVGVRYAFELGRGELSSQLDYAWTSRVPITRLNADVSTPIAIEREWNAPQGLLNANVTYEIEDAGLSLSLWATNLTDERDQQAGVLATNNVGWGSGFNLPPRMWGVTIRKQLGAE